MKKSQEIIGLPVFSIIDGIKLGQVNDLIINPEEGKVDFLLVSNSSWYTGGKVLPYQAVMSVGEDAVTTESGKQLGAINENADAQSLIQRNITVKGNRALTNQGNFVGVISEYEIDEKSGKLMRLEYQTILDETKIEVIAGDNVITYGAEVIVIKFQGGTKPDPVQTVEEIKEDPANKTSDSTNLFKERQKQFLLGKKVIQDIKDADGAVIISEGTVITEETCNIAESKGKFVELSQCAK